MLPTGHSPLGASGASRFIACPGSVTLSRGHTDEESDHAALGTAAHWLAESCLITNSEAWKFIGAGTPGGIVVDREMANAVQVYVDFITRLGGRGGREFIEYRFHCPDLHALYYGTIDYALVLGQDRVLTVVDYKHGAGIVVEAENNPQIMYYAAGIMETLDLWHAIDSIRCVIVQPRGFHYKGPIREWTISTEDLDVWLAYELVPAMERALVSTETVSGEHCRFCPARSYACPQLMADMDELETLMNMVETSKKGADELTNAQVERLLQLCERATIVKKAAEKTAFNRLQNGATFEHYKLGNAKVNREWKEDAAAALEEKFGDDAFDVKLKSPAKIEELPEGEKFTARYAFKPEVGLALVKMGDARPAVNRDTKSLFTPVKKGKKA